MGEVQAGGRGRHRRRAGRRRRSGSARGRRAAVDVRRQGHRPQRRQQIGARPPASTEPHLRGSRRPDASPTSTTGRPPASSTRAGRQPAAGPDQGRPRSGVGPGAGGLEQQHLGRAAGRLAQPEPGRQHPGGVDDQQVARRRAGRAGRAPCGGRARPPGRRRPAGGPRRAARPAPGRWPPRAVVVEARPRRQVLAAGGPLNRNGRSPVSQAQSNRAGDGPAAAAARGRGGARPPAWPPGPAAVRISRPSWRRNGS